MSISIWNRNRVALFRERIPPRMPVERSAIAPLRSVGPLCSVSLRRFTRHSKAMRIHLPLALLLFAGCSGHAAREDQLNAAANQSTPEASNVLAGAAANGMNEQAALNEAAEAQTSNSGNAAAPRYQARPNSTQNP